MFKKLYDKSEILFSILWIVAYCVLMSAGDSLSGMVGVEKSITLPVALSMSVLLLAFLKKNKLFEHCGLCPSKLSAGAMLYYLPVVVMLTANLWYGVTLNYGAVETVLYIFTMLCVGLLEELIFRGLLFNAMRKDNVKIAVIVSSVTFGIGHIINLVNGSGAELIPNMLQIIYATAAGFMFVMMYYRSASIIPCIAAHGIFNAMSAFAKEAQTVEARVISCILLTVITGAYAIYLALTSKEEQHGA
jgi:membrane protease YdiL (CAAX protease family)